MTFFPGIRESRVKIDRLAPPDNSKKLNVSLKRHGLAPKLSGEINEFLSGDGVYRTPTGTFPGVHASSHEDGGTDEISVAGLSGLLATAQTPAAHKASHQDAGSDEIDVTGLAGLLVTAQTPIGGPLASGVYTPTASAASNLDATPTPSEAQYLRVGATVLVSGRFTADPTAPGAASFELSLPVASNLGAVEDLAGTAAGAGIAGLSAAVFGSAANNTAVVSWIAVDITSQAWSYSYAYQIV